jgi:hypothetical protein
MVIWDEGLPCKRRGDYGRSLYTGNICSSVSIWSAVCVMNISTNNAYCPGYVWGLELYSRGKHLHNPATSYWSVCTKSWKWTVMYALGISILRLSSMLLFDFGIVPTVWYFSSSFYWYRIGTNKRASSLKIHRYYRL